MKRNLLILFVLSIVGLSVQSQSRVITGIITDQQSKAGLAGVSITVKGSEMGTVSDALGTYHLNIPVGSKAITFSYVGYQLQEIILNQQNIINVELARGSGLANEIVVTALGIQRQSKTLTYATQQLRGKELAEVKDPTGSLANSLSGKVAGLTVTQSASGPGGANRVILRGNRSISGSNNALFVVDGVAVDNDSRAQLGGTGGGNNPSDGAGNINPDDIETVNVLKGASAAALYGSRAANGVIIITTKKGRAGKTSIDVNSGISVSTAGIMPDWQNVYGQGSGGGIYDAKAEKSWGPKMEGQEITDWKGKASTLTPQEDNINDFFRNALTINNSFGVTTGNDKTQAYMSYTNNRIEGLIRTNELNRHTMNLRLNAQLSERFSVEGKVTYMVQKLENKPLVGEFVGATTYSLFQVPRSIRTADMKDFESFDASGKRIQNYWLPGSSVLNNPYWEMNRRAIGEERNRITAFGLARYNITKWLSAQVRYSLDRYTDRLEEKDYVGSYFLASSINTGRYGLGTNYVNERNLDFLLSGNNNLGNDFTINYNIGGQVLRRNMEYNYNTTGPLIYPELFIPSNSATLAPSYAYSLRELQGIYATTQVSFRDYLLLDITGRNDWSSTLPAANRSYFYPSVGVSAIVSDMIALPSWVSFAKVRASYSHVGNDAEPYAINQTYTVQQGGLNGWLRPGSTQVLGDKLKPELTRSYEAGIDWRFLADRLGIDVTLYHTNTINQLLRLSLPVASGYGSKFINAGNIENKGVEIILTGTPVKGNKFSWNTTFNIAANRNKVIAITPELKKFSLTSDRIANVAVVEGGRIGDLFTDAWATDDKTGVLLIDNNGLPVITPALSKYMGNYNPDWMMGLSNTLRYGKLSFSFLLEGRIGGIIVSGGDALRTFTGSVTSTLPYREGGWILPGNVQSTGQPNTKAINAEQFWSKMGGKTPRGEQYTYDATNYRLREINLGYTFSNIFKVIRSARIALVGRNLLFLYRGKSLFDIPGIGKRTMDFDPDATIGAGNTQGLENQALPTPRTIGFNLTLGF